jgi:serine/threonine protein kinase
VKSDAQPAGGQGSVTSAEGEANRRWGLGDGDSIVPGRYVVDRLGGGSDYEAFLAWDERMLALVVAKCLRPHLVDDAGALRRLRRESDYLLGLRHPVVVRGFDAVLDGPRPHVVMEHLEGPNLASLLRRHGPLAPQQLLPLALQACGALHYLAEERVVHLDVKPRNIIMGAPPRLIDLSVARSHDDARRITAQIGTDPYMAPEQCSPGLTPIGPPADVWGLGATLFHAISGHVPFLRPDYERDRDDDNLHVRFPQLHQEPPPLPRGVPAPVVEVVRDCLAKDPHDRPSTGEIVERLEPAVVGLSTKPVLRRLRPRLR